TAAERILGMNILEMKGKELRDLQWKYIYEDGSDISWKNHPPMLALKTGEKISNVVMGLYNPSGKYTTWININSVPQFYSGEKTPYQVYSTFFDITEQKKAETIQNVLFNISQLTIQTLSLPELIKEIHQQVVRLMDSRNFYVALVYDKNKSLFTFPYIVDVIPEELIEPDKIVNLSGGFTDYILKKESPLLANKYKFQKMLNDGEVTLIGTKAETWLGVPLITPTGEVIGVVVVQSYEDSDAYTENDLEVLVIISRTIAWAIKFKQTEVEKFELKEKLQRSEKMEALGRLAGGVAHDLNNVLNAIVGYPDLILNKIPDDSQLRRLISLIRKSGEKAAAIVDDLLTLARRGVPIKEVVSLNLLVDDYLKSPECKKLLHYHPKVKLKTYIEDDIFRIKGSLIHLAKMIMNLISNAAEAMIEGGDLNISVSNYYIDRPKKLYDGIINEGNYVLLKVTDCGVGISSKDLTKIFEPFYSKKVMGRSGTGLGMAVVWGTVKDHKGHIHIRSKEGAGTTFEVYLPITREEISQQYKDMKVNDYMGKGESILVVDDIQEQREIATTLLSSLGYSVDQVSSGEEAIKYIKTNRVDLLLLDMVMEPGLDGLDTYRYIKKINPDQKAVIVSGFSETERIKEAQSLGVGKYVKKPYSLEKIGVALRIVLDS
ncbi:MAG: response regulator, partial [Candidatus Aminicenantes bacterium]|nr:response regulator [Candidatus Aminicenantes bacterium]